MRKGEKRQTFVAGDPKKGIKAILSLCFANNSIQNLRHRQQFFLRTNRERENAQTALRAQPQRGGAHSHCASRIKCSGLAPRLRQHTETAPHLYCLQNTHFHPKT